MGSVEGELLETYLQTRFLMVKPWKGVKELAVGAREVADVGMWKLQEVAVHTCGGVREVGWCQECNRFWL